MNRRIHGTRRLRASAALAAALALGAGTVALAAEEPRARPSPRQQVGRVAPPSGNFVPFDGHVEFHVEARISGLDPKFSSVTLGCAAQAEGPFSSEVNLGFANSGKTVTFTRDSPAHTAEGGRIVFPPYRVGLVPKVGGWGPAEREYHPTYWWRCQIVSLRGTAGRQRLDADPSSGPDLAFDPATYRHAIEGTCQVQGHTVSCSR